MEITKEGYIEDFLGVNTDKVYIDAYHLSQTQLIKHIVAGLGL